MNKTENTLHKKTPSVTVLSNRGQVVRDIVYHRHPDTPEKTDERITRHQFDSRGFLKESADPRLQASGLANFRYITSLSGQVLRTESADAGTSLALNDAAGRPATSVHQIGTENGQDDSSRAVTQTFRYEGADSAGRPLSIAEQTAGQSTQVTERFVYAGSSEAEKAKNLAGICTHHYEPAGLMQTDSIALTGVPLSVTRQLLKDADNPDIAVNWPESDPESLLSAEKYTTQTTADATGAVLNTTDAAGHRQKMTYDIAGLLSTSRVTVKGGAEKIIIKSVMYSAAGQKLREEHGNGVVTTYTYEPQTQRLIAVKTEHPARKKIFQDLRYEYDPVGNVLCVTNSAEETRFWRNQKVVPENRYTYDTLYQLVSATGREMANAGQQSSALPDISPFDKATYTSYTRNYIYDCAGNMTQIRHSAPATNNNYTTDITVSQRSNRAVLKTLADTPEKAEALFTPGGQQTQLQPGQTLSWTARGELQQVTPVVRNGAAGDCESYRYDAGSRRILKTAVQKTGNSTQTQQVIYLPGLELHSGKENYQVICAGVAGRAQVRLLHWQDGKKDHQRFSYDNLIGSSGLETDGDGNLLSQEEYYPFGGTAVLVADADSGIDYKTHRYSGKERDATGLYYYGYRYYQPWAGRWLSSDPAGTVDGLNLFRMVRNNPVTLYDNDGRAPVRAALSAGSFRDMLPEPAVQYQRGLGYQLTKSVSQPNLYTASQQTGEGGTFIGYHGTNEQSAKNILGKGLDIDMLPHGQIGQGFYVAKDRYLAEGSANPDGGRRKAELDRNIPFFRKIQNSLLGLFGSYFNAYKFSPDYPDNITPALLKVYKKQPLVNSQWNSMLRDDLSGIQFAKPDERQAVSDTIMKSMGKNLQMVIPSDEFSKLSLTRDNGITETGIWHPANESHSPEGYQIISATAGKNHILRSPDESINTEMVDQNSQIRKRFNNNKAGYMRKRAA